MTRRAARSSGRGGGATAAVARGLVCFALAAAAATARGDAGAPPWPPAPPRSAPHAAVLEARLARLESEIIDRALRMRFDEPDVPGSHGRDAMIIPVTQAVLDSDRTFRAETARQLAEFEAADSALSPGRRADVAVLEAQFERLGLERDVLRRFETDPGRIWPRVDGGIRPLLVGRPGVLCRRLVRATRRMRGVPEALRAVQVGLDRPSRLAVETAMERFGLTLTLCRRDIPLALRDCREPVASAGLAEADTLAARSLQEFVVWLAGDVLPQASGSWAMGAETYSRWLRAATGDSTPIAALRERAEHELESSERSGRSAVVLHADSARAALADSLLEARAERLGRGTFWVRTVLGRRELALPWAAYAARVSGAPRAGSTAQVPRFAASRLDLVGLLVEIDLHTGSLSIDAARSRLMRDAGLDSAAAETEARVAALAPARAAAAVTAWQLESARAEAAAKLGSRFSPRAFLAAAIDEGAVPVAAIREPLLRKLRVWDAARRAP